MKNFHRVSEQDVVFVVDSNYEKVSVLIDRNDEDTIKNYPFPWFVKEVSGKYRVVSSSFRKGEMAYIELPHLLLNAPFDSDIRYENGNAFDCRKSNIEVFSLNT